MESVDDTDGTSILQDELSKLRGDLRLRDAEINYLKSRMKVKSSRGLMLRAGSTHLLDLSGSHHSESESPFHSDERDVTNYNEADGLKGEAKQNMKKKSPVSTMFNRKKKKDRGSGTVIDRTVDAGKSVLGKVFKFKNERQKRLSTTQLNTKSKTKWDNAVDLIDDLMYDDDDKLTEQQKAGLKDVQELLLGGGLKGDDFENSYYIPMKLLESRGFSLRNGASQRTLRDLRVRSYVLREYGGISSTRKRPSLLRQSGYRLSGSDITMFSTLDEWDDSIPAEFQSLSPQEKNDVARILTWEKLKAWDFDIFELDQVSKGHPLVLMGWAVLGAPHAQHAMAKCCDTLRSSSDVDFSEGYNFVESTLKIPLEKLCMYLRLVEDHYRQGNPYHNAIHAADVVQSLHALIQMAGDELKTTDEEIFSALLASVVHDVDHPGLNNGYQVNARTNLALQYNDISVLENHHASIAFTMMIKSSPLGNGMPTEFAKAESANIFKDSDFNILCNLENEQYAEIKSKTIEAILHTDMKLHFKTVSKIKGLIISEETRDEADTAWQILIFMLHMADISNAGKAGAISRKWTDRCLEEFFNQGDQEKRLGIDPSPQCDRLATSKPDSQIGFIQFVVQPAFELLACIIPKIRGVIIPQLENNKKFWEAESMIVGDKTTKEESDDDLSSINCEKEDSDSSSI